MNKAQKVVKPQHRLIILLSSKQRIVFIQNDNRCVELARLINAPLIMTLIVVSWRIFCGTFSIRDYDVFTDGVVGGFCWWEHHYLVQVFRLLNTLLLYLNQVGPIFFVYFCDYLEVALYVLVLWLKFNCYDQTVNGPFHMSGASVIFVELEV